MCNYELRRAHSGTQSQLGRADRARASGCVRKIFKAAKPEKTDLEKLKISRVIVVEGKYDKIRLESLIDGHIITTEGFGIFRDRDKTEYFRRLAEAKGLIVATDSDGAGLVIRNYFNSIIPAQYISHVYIPGIPGKERRKSAPSKEGTLGLEGMDTATLRALFIPFSSEAEKEDSDVNQPASEEVTALDLYNDGFKGGKDSAYKRKALLRAARLPENISSKAMLGAINSLGGKKFYETVKEKANEGFLQKTQGNN